MRLQKEAKGYLDSLRGKWYEFEVGDHADRNSYDGLSDAYRGDD